MIMHSSENERRMKFVGRWLFVLAALKALNASASVSLSPAELSSVWNAMKPACEDDVFVPEKAEKMAKILLAQANLLAGLPLEDPQEYTKLVCELFPTA